MVVFSFNKFIFYINFFLIYKNNIFLKKYRPLTPSLRFKKTIFKNFFFKKKFSLFFFLKKNSNVRTNRGMVVILSKGKITKHKTTNFDKFRCFNKKICVLINLVNIKKKTFGLIKYSNGSMSYIQPSYGFFLGDFSFATNRPEMFWFFNLPGIVILIRFAKKFTILNNVFVNNKYSYASSNGTFCQINENYEDLGLALISLPSGKEKMIKSFIFGSLGKCYNDEYNLTNPGKAGNLKIRGLKSRVRGVAKNPVDHPHGGRTKTNKPEVSPWGWVAKKNK